MRSTAHADFTELMVRESNLNCVPMERGDYYHCTIAGADLFTSHIYANKNDPECQNRDTIPVRITVAAAAVGGPNGIPYNVTLKTVRMDLPNTDGHIITMPNEISFEIYGSDTRIFKNGDPFFSNSSQQHQMSSVVHVTSLCTANPKDATWDYYVSTNFFY